MEEKVSMKCVCVHDFYALFGFMNENNKKETIIKVNERKQRENKVTNLRQSSSRQYIYRQNCLPIKFGTAVGILPMTMIVGNLWTREAINRLLTIKAVEKLLTPPTINKQVRKLPKI